MALDIPSIVSQMTLVEKASLCSGLDFWHTKPIPRLGVPSIMVTDGPHGLRKQADGQADMGIAKSVPATCFPTASATASSWDRSLMEAIGQALGEECQQEDVAVILGPGANLKRSPLCGRNFEYFSEDPFLAGEMAGSLIQGVQSQGVGTSLKHFAVNNQEHLRMTINSVVDERALREIYLAGFERAVKKGQPWTVMCAYNMINGAYCSENKRLLTRILRDEWGFTGLVLTDWGACNDRVAGLKAGQDLEMPASMGLNDAKIVAAVQSGALDGAILDRAVTRLLELVAKWSENHKSGFRYDAEAHHALARRAAAESAVLLKNEDGILPLNKETKIAVIGAFARTPRYQGAGSSLITPLKLENAQDEFAQLGVDFTYAAGYELKSDVPNETLITAACDAARQAAVAVVFAGLPNVSETEGVDRDHMRLPESHNQLIQRVAEANPNIVVVLSNGAPLEMPWIGVVKAILEGYLGGEAGGPAAVDVLYGTVNPSGKLAETFALQGEDHLAAHYFPMGTKTVEYRESLYIGYRYFDAAQKPVLFPFGFGLSYTSFAYSGLQVSKLRLTDAEDLLVSLKVKNTGSVAGAEIVQLYIHDVDATVFRPYKELKGFEKVFLQPGEEKTVSFSLDKRSFAFYNPTLADWQVESGSFEILVGASSAEFRARSVVWVDSTQAAAPGPDLRQAAPIYYNLPGANRSIPDGQFKALYGRDLPTSQRLPGEPLDLNSTLGDAQSTFLGRQLYKIVTNNARKMFGESDNDAMNRMMAVMMVEMPLRNMVMMSNGQFTFEMVNGLLLIMNGKPFKGLWQVYKASRKKLRVKELA